jgi:hypothetical protein
MEMSGIFTVLVGELPIWELAEDDLTDLGYRQFLGVPEEDGNTIVQEKTATWQYFNLLRQLLTLEQYKDFLRKAGVTEEGRPLDSANIPTRLGVIIALSKACFPHRLSAQDELDASESDA